MLRFLTVLFLLLAASPALALDSVTVLADREINSVIAEIARNYSREKNVVVNVSFAPEAAQQKQLLEGGDGDVLITPSRGWIEALKTQGLVDIYSEMLFAQKPPSEDAPWSVEYFAVAIAGNNMEQARSFLDYLKSSAPRPVLRKYRLSAD